MYPPEVTVIRFGVIEKYDWPNVFFFSWNRMKNSIDAFLQPFELYDVASDTRQKKNGGR